MIQQVFLLFLWFWISANRRKQKDWYAVVTPKIFILCWTFRSLCYAANKLTSLMLFHLNLSWMGNNQGRKEGNRKWCHLWSLNPFEKEGLSFKLGNDIFDISSEWKAHEMWKLSFAVLICWKELNVLDWCWFFKNKVVWFGYWVNRLICAFFYWVEAWKILVYLKMNVFLLS